MRADQETDGFSINDLAFHYDEAGNKEKAVKYSLQAGKVALSRFSNVEAIKHFKYVLETIAEDLNSLSQEETLRKDWATLTMPTACSAKQ